MTTILPNAAARIAAAKTLRDTLTNADNAIANPGVNPNTDKTTLNLAALYAKALTQNPMKPGLPVAATFDTFNATLNMPTAPSAMPGGILGGSAKLNGPMGAFAWQLTCEDSAQYGSMSVPAPPLLSSKEYATELVELYWASLLRDVPFTEYAGNRIAIDAAQELDSLKASYAGPLDASGSVTPAVLFRGGFNSGTTTGHVLTPGAGRYFAGELIGPYLSQFCLQPAHLGVLGFDQRFWTLPPHVDYLLDETTWNLIQSGQPTGLSLTFDKTDTRYLHTGRSIAAYTHEDELYQAYLIAYLVMSAILIPPNPTSPYAPPAPLHPSEKAFGTFGGPDIAATLGAVAKAAIDAVWYQKWVVHLRHRPESGGGLVHYQRKGGVAYSAEETIHASFLNSKALEKCLAHFKSDFLAQAFPEGSPTHPAYPTGHGTVAGACITVLKFFFDGNAVIPNPVQPSPDGKMLAPYSYTSADTDVMRVNGELHKLAHNISFGHGIHAGIHWRSDTDFSMLLGEEVAISFLNDQVKTYAEKVNITITRMNGDTVTFSN